MTFKQIRVDSFVRSTCAHFRDGFKSPIMLFSWCGFQFELPKWYFNTYFNKLSLWNYIEEIFYAESERAAHKRCQTKHRKQVALNLGIKLKIWFSSLLSFVVVIDFSSVKLVSVYAWMGLYARVACIRSSEHFENQHNTIVMP